MKPHTDKSPKPTKLNFRAHLKTLKLKLYKECKSSLAALKPLWAERKWFLIIFIILTVAYLALIRANFYYADDLLREASGLMGWDDFSRFSTLGLAGLLQLSTYMTDLSPLTTLLAIAILSLTCVILLYVFKVKLFGKKIQIWDALAILILAISPYYLECMSYKFDAPFMAVSILACVIPFLFYRISYFTFLSASFLGTLLMCTTYQASSGIFPMLVILVSAIEWLRGTSWKEIGKFVAASALAYSAATLFFKFVLMHPIATYVSNEIFPLPRLIPGILNKLKIYYKTVLSDFTPLWLTLSLVLIFSFIVTYTHRAIYAAKKEKWFALGLAIFIVFLIGISAFGLYVALMYPLTSPRAMYGIGVALALLALMTTCMIEKKGIIVKSAVTLTAYSFIIFATAYGNMLAVQDEATKFRAQHLASELAHLDIMQTDEIKTIKILGTIGQSEPLQNYIDHTGANIMKRLIPIQLSGGDSISAKSYFFQYLGLKNCLNAAEIETLTAEEHEPGALIFQDEKWEISEYDMNGWKKSHSDMYQDIYTKDDLILVVLK